MKLFIGVVPERKEEMELFVQNYTPEFSLAPDSEGAVLEGGLYKYVRHSFRFLCVVWVSAFAAWEGYTAVFEAVNKQADPDFTRFKDLLAFLDQVLHSADPMDNWDSEIPPPGHLADAAESAEKRAIAELAMFATTWTFLHEIRHIRHQQDGTSSSYGTKEQQHDEELSCDAFATLFMTEKAAEYAATSNQPEHLVLQKRRLGIYFAMFAITVIGKDCLVETDSHPSVRRRIKAVIDASGGKLNHPELAITLGIFTALQCVFPDAPLPFEI